MTTQPEAPKPYYAVGLDGCLSTLTLDGSIGAPIPAMLARVKKWIADGHEVRILTPRVAAPLDQTELDATTIASITAIMAWCEQHVGRALRITSRIEPGLIELWDTAAVGVLLNRGISREDLLAFNVSRVMAAANQQVVQGQPYGVALEALAERVKVITNGAEDAVAHLDSARDALDHIKIETLPEDAANLVRQARTSLVRGLQPLMRARGL